MFSKRQATAYCRESIQRIDGYNDALTSNDLYDLHHKFEQMALSCKDLMELGMYYKRPACELIFIKKSEHSTLHNRNRWCDASRREQVSVWSKSVWQEPEFRQKQKDGLHKVQATAEYRVNLSNGIKLKKPSCKLQLGFYLFDKLEFGGDAPAGNACLVQYFSLLP